MHELSMDTCGVVVVWTHVASQFSTALGNTRACIHIAGNPLDLTISHISHYLVGVSGARPGPMTSTSTPGGHQPYQSLPGGCQWGTAWTHD